MNERLIDLYFQVKKEFDKFSKKEDEQIQVFIDRLSEENKKAPPDQSRTRNSMLEKIQNKISKHPIESSGGRAIIVKIQQECRQSILKILEEILGDDLIQAKRMLREKQLKKIVEEFVDEKNRI